MYYFEVAIRGSHGEKSIFTYHYEQKLAINTLVEVKLRAKKLVGIVWDEVPSKPTFKTQSIINASTIKLSPELRSLAIWLSKHYVSTLGASLLLVLPKSISSTPKPRKETIPSSDRGHVSDSPLTREQKAALEQLSSIQRGTVLLHGDTGTGKTRIYAEIAKRALRSYKSVVILVPEIGMTQQLASDIEALTPVKPISLHSGKTVAQRQKDWLEIDRTETPQIIIGTRSALFAPLKNVGAIIVDEAHDSSYKSDAAPRFNAVRAASFLGDTHKCIVVLGSATPSVADYALATQKQAPIIRLKRQASGQKREITSTIVDRRQRDQFTKSNYFSNQSIDAINTNLTTGKQTLIFLNRRGTAKLCLCKMCGWFAECATCQLPLTYHGNKQLLICHSCGVDYPMVTSCPSCGSVELSYQTPGVQALEAEVSKLFPDAKALRIDSDNAPDEGLVKHYQALYDGEIDILIGTQSIAKGLDLPKLNLEIIVDADAGLHMPDYLAGERMFQLLYQVMGRIGRHEPGELIVQTLTPDHPIITEAIKRDYHSFYDREMTARKILNYPPFSHSGRVIVEHKDEAIALRLSLLVKDKIMKQARIRSLGPSPCFYAKLRGKYRYQIFIMSAQRSRLAAVAAILPKEAYVDLDPVQLL